MTTPPDDLQGVSFQGSTRSSRERGFGCGAVKDVSAR
jgi:hypothetical protein